MIAAITAAIALQSEATTEGDARRAAEAFLRRLGMNAGGLRAELIAAPDWSRGAWAFDQGESVWRLSSTRNVVLYVPYRAAYVAQFEDSGSAARPRRAGWSAMLPARKARGLAIATLHGLGIPSTWRGMVGDRFNSPPGRWPPEQLWPFMAQTRLAEWPFGKRCYGRGNSAEIMLEPETGAVRWFSQRRDVRFVRPRTVVSPAVAAKAATTPGTPFASGDAQLVWDGRSEQYAPRLAYLFGRGRGGTFVDAETGRIR